MAQVGKLQSQPPTPLLTFPPDPFHASLLVISALRRWGVTGASAVAGDIWWGVGD